jgi:hypothetical protein
MNITITNKGSDSEPITTLGAWMSTLEPGESMSFVDPGPMIVGHKPSKVSVFETFMDATRRFFGRVPTHLVCIQVTNHEGHLQVLLEGRFRCDPAAGETYEACAPGYVELR